MACNRFSDALMGALYGELTPPEERAFREHLPTCAACQEEWAALGGVKATMARAAPLPEPPEALTQRILDAARRPGTAPVSGASRGATGEKVGGFWAWLSRPWVVGLAAASGAAALILALSPSKMMMPTSAVTGAPQAAPVVAPRRNADAESRRNVAADSLSDVREDAPIAGLGDDEDATSEMDSVVAQPRNNGRAAGKTAKKDRASPPQKPMDERAEAKAEKRVAAPEPMVAERVALPSAPAAVGQVAARQEPVAMEERKRALEAEESAAPPSGSSSAALLQDKKAPMPQVRYARPLMLPPPPRDADGSARKADAPAEAEPAAEAQAWGVGAAKGRRMLAPETLPKLEAQKAKEASNPAAKAMAKDMAALKQTDALMKAQMDLNAGTELLATQENERALVAFKRAAQLDTAHELAPNPRIGQAVALARMDRCAESQVLIDDVGRKHPTFFKRVQSMEELAACFDRTGQTALAKKVRLDAQGVRAAAGNKLSNPTERAARARTAAALVAQDRRALEVCQRTGVARGELNEPTQFHVSLVLDPRGVPKNIQVNAKPAAPATLQCLRVMVGAAQFPSGPDAELEVDFAVTLKARAPQKP